jgi:thiol-disulfide isomerase/thioredoxin
MLFGVLLLAGGCGETPPDPRPLGPDSGSAPLESPAPSSPQVESSSPAAESSAPSAKEVPIRVATWSEVEQLIAAQNGKVVVLDFWSTWCVPCLREFPGLVALHEKYGEQVACISVNCNFTGAAGENPEDAREEIEEFLQKQRATFENVIVATPDLELYDLLDIASVPVVRVYDKEGQLRKQFVNDDNEYGDEGFTYQQHIAPLVVEMLNDSAP